MATPRFTQRKQARGQYPPQTKPNEKMQVKMKIVEISREAMEARVSRFDALVPMQQQKPDALPPETGDALAAKYGPQVLEEMAKIGITFDSETG